MQQAIISIVTDIPAYKLGIYYSYIESAIILCGTFYCLIKRLISNNKIIFLTMGLMLFSTGIEEYSVVTYVWHLYILPMSLTIAMGFILLTLEIIFIQNEQKWNGGLFVISILFLITTTMTKGPAGAIVLVGIGIMCIYWLTVKREYLKALSYGIGSLISFCTVYVILLMERKQLYNVEQTNVNITWNYKEFFADIKNYFAYFLTLNPWIFIPATVFILFCVCKKKKNIENYIMFIMIMIGTILGYVIQYYGNSQMYFALSVFPCAAILAGKMFLEVDNHIFSIKKTMICSLFVLCSIGLLHYNYGDELAKSVRRGMNRNHSYYESENFTILSQKECMSYDWIRINTGEQAILLSDRWFEDKIQNRVQSVISERRVYNYDTGLVDEEKGRILYSGHTEYLEEFINAGITHVICHKRISPQFDLDENVGQLIFENSDVKVYQLGNIS